MQHAENLFAAILFLLLAHGCKEADLDGLFTVTCERAVKEYYKQNCELPSDNGSLFGVTQSEAMALCETWEVEADSYGCNKELETLLVCMNNIPEDECDECSDEFTARHHCQLGLDDELGDCNTFVEFECNDGTCIPQSYRCDGVDHCPFAEDEADCD